MEKGRFLVIFRGKRAKIGPFSHDTIIISQNLFKMNILFLGGF
jgi:hypothetical protein